MPASSSLPAARPLAFAAFGASSLFFLDVLCFLASPHHDVVFHLSGPASALFIPALANVLLLTLVLTLLLFIAELHVRTRRIAWSALLALLPFAVTKNISFLLNKTVPHAASVTVFILCIAIFCFGAFLLSNEAANRALEAGRVLLFTAAFAGLILCVETAWDGFAARHLNDSVATKPPTTTTPHGPILWIVLDELAYKQLYEDRPADLDLPAFDALRTESTIFTHAQAAANYTEIALPALLTGHATKDVRSSTDGHQLLLQSTSGQWSPFNEHDTAFADAQSLNATTAVAGWYIPYCRILPTVLNDCYWTSQTALSNMFPAKTIGTNILHPAIRLALKIPAFFHHPTGPSRDELAEGQLHIHDYIALDNATDRLLTTNQYDVILLHIPVPHPTGIYDRKTHTFAVDRTNYIDNLALADVYLAHVRALLEARHAWDATTVLIMGDHSWRTKLLWQNVPPWTPEDQQASSGGFDDRPAYIVKLAHQQSPATIDTPYAAIRTRALIDAILRDQIKTPANLKQWAASSVYPPR